MSRLPKSSKSRRPARRAPVATDRRFKKSSHASDTGPRERWQHSGRVLEFTEQAGMLAARATEEHVIDTLVERRILDERQRLAAMKFKLDYQRAGLAPHVTGSYTPIRRGEDVFYHERERSDIQEAAYQRWRNAVRELGLRCSDAVISTACHDLLPVPRKLVALQKGLELLAEWYGIAEDR